jgi:hypothetical protein
MTINFGDPKLGATLDAVTEALKKIYDGKRDGTATPNDDIRLKKLHVEWVAIMRKISDGEQKTCGGQPFRQVKMKAEILSPSWLGYGKGRGSKQRKWVFRNTIFETHRWNAGRRLRVKTGKAEGRTGRGERYPSSTLNPKRVIASWRVRL